ncbi:hypothetical protein [Roseovarius atlanticus]|nr:hypothetical protein [Roseovarius atlanticus]MBY5988219.1 hypothetical protein [Roseovarius atlanticus]MBY6123610.1 hypothetical protein [Roseovarius atlanticus]MBY6148105.1 hypothetical protein [Roseovarius atlanticus]
MLKPRNINIELTNRAVSQASGNRLAEVAGRISAKEALSAIRPVAAGEGY